LCCSLKTADERVSPRTEGTPEIQHDEKSSISEAARLRALAIEAQSSRQSESQQCPCETDDVDAAARASAALLEPGSIVPHS
jgi:hypothetical protein